MVLDKCEMTWPNRNSTNGRSEHSAISVYFVSIAYYPCGAAACMFSKEEKEERAQFPSCVECFHSPFCALS